MRPSWRIRGGRQGSNRFSVCRRLWGSSFGLTPPPGSWLSVCMRLWGSNSGLTPPPRPLAVWVQASLGEQLCAQAALMAQHPLPLGRLEQAAPGEPLWSDSPASSV